MVSRVSNTGPTAVWFIILVLSIFMPQTSTKLVGYIAFALFVCLSHFFDMCHDLRTMHAMVLKFSIWMSHEKLGDLYFFLCRQIHPFRVFLFFNILNCILVNKITKKI